jgi:hypothetical protein
VLAAVPAILVCWLNVIRFDSPPLVSAAVPPTRQQLNHVQSLIMRIKMRYIFTMLLATVAFALVAPRPAAAVLQFYQVYKTEYLDNHPDKKYVAEVDKGTNKCFVCHQGKKSRKNHNQFGLPLVESLDRKKDLKDKEKIKAEIAKVVAMNVDPKDKKSETYLDRIKASKWPGGELKALMEEPKEEEKKDEKK